MKKLVVLAAVALAPIAFMNVAHADAALAQSKGCTACHQLEKKVIGPAYGQVAACYNVKDAKKLAENKAKLAKHVKEGGSGVWGMIPMPAHPQVSNEDINKIIDWALSAKPTECPKEFKPKS